jgi:hypothetical protein
MAVRIKSITFDSADPCLAQFWGQLTGFREDPDHRNAPGGPEALFAQATGQAADLPDDLAAQSLAFARTQLTGRARPDQFGPARAVAEQAPAIERRAAFLGRPVSFRTRADD